MIDFIKINEKDAILRLKMASFSKFEFAIASLAKLTEFRYFASFYLIKSWSFDKSSLIWGFPLFWSSLLRDYTVLVRAFWATKNVKFFYDVPKWYSKAQFFRRDF